MKRSLVAGFLLVLFSANSWALESPFTNLDKIVSRLQIKSLLKHSETQSPVRIAILDNGFKNFESEVGRTLPRHTQFHVGPIVVPETEMESHGTAMAQIVAGILDQASSGTFDYELHLYSAFGYSNFSSAVNNAIARKVDIILYSQVWEYGGFGKGRGFINEVVSRATNAGIIWVNAAGNFAQGTYQARITASSDDWAKLPAQNDSLRIRCEAPAGNKCLVRIVLSWNDFNDNVNVGTDKDLDLVLSDDALKIIRTSHLQQKKDFPEGQAGMSKYPREIVEAEIDPGLYLARVKIRSTNFTRRDELRFTVSGDHVVLLDKTSETDPLNPADHPKAITVGASDSELSSHSSSKPEVLLPSLITLENNEAYKGSSNSAAMFAAVAAAYKSMNPKLNRTQLLKKWRASGAESNEQDFPQSGSWPHEIPSGPQDTLPGLGLPLFILQFEATGPGCFSRTQINNPPGPLQPLLRDGAIVVETTAGKKVFTPVDPMSVIHGVYRVNISDMVVATPRGYFIYPRHQQHSLPRDFYEVVQQPEGQYICSP